MEFLREVLEKLAKHEISIEEAEKRIKLLAVEEIEELAKIDLHREKRSGIPEAILALGKHAKDVASIAKRVAEKKGMAMITKAGEETLAEVKKLENEFEIEIKEKANIAIVRKRGFEIKACDKARVAVISAGTGDIPVAEEAKIAAKLMGCRVYSYYDVGIAGLHRVFSPLKEIIKNNVSAIIVVAGMEGALPSVVASMVDIPVIGVPTSVSYGAGGKGKAALLSMLNSCAPGLAVVNIDNGFGAGVFAALIAKKVAINEKTEGKRGGKDGK